MNAFPDSDWLRRKRTIEKAVAASWPVLIALTVCLAVVLVLGLVVTLTQAAVIAGLIGIAAIWIVAACVLFVFCLRKPWPKEVAMRADRVIGLQDDLLSLSEFPEDLASQEWREAAWKRASEDVAARKLLWKIPFPRRNAILLAGAVCVTIAAIFVMAGQGMRIAGEQAAIAEEQADRAAAAEEILEDWEKFVEVTEDPELKKVFAEAAALREALKQEDPMAAMLAMNQIEAKLSSLQASLAAESMGPQAAGIAEALESFEGMGALSAALRNQNYESAASEAEKLKEQLSKAGDSKMRRTEVLSEMLANESKTAKSRGNQSLSESLSKLSELAKKNAETGSVSNEDLKPCVGELKDQFSKESTKKAGGRMAAIGKSQLDALRNKLRGEDCEAPPSLCNSMGNKPGGLKAGKGTDGQPLGEQTDLAQAGQSEKLTGTMGEGESEVTTSSANSGTAAATGAATKAGINEYFELSQKAVADESLPLAHRRTIRTYFERIRPVAESQIP